MADSNKKNEKNRFLESIIEDKNLAEYKKYFKNKTGWNNFENFEEKDIKNFANKIVAAIQNQIKETNFKENYSDTSDHKSRFFVTYRKKNVNGKAVYLPYRVEEALERVLVVKNNEKFKNQIVLPDGGHIDFVMDINDGDATFVELKMWTNNSDNPLYALVEVLKNYFLFKALNNELEKNSNCKNIRECFIKHEIKNIVKLLILAPKEYFEIYNKAIGKKDLKVAFDKLYKLITEIKNLKSIEIELKYIDLKYEDWQKTMSQENLTNKKIDLRIYKNEQNLSKCDAKEWCDLAKDKEFVNQKEK